MMPCANTPPILAQHQDQWLRFWGKVSFGPDCWEWTDKGSILPGGYGRYYFQARSYLAHRLAYELLVGPIPPRLIIDHLCRNRRCVNPAHLEPVTYATNSRRGMRGMQTHCRRAGHPLEKVDKLGKRYCHHCSNARHRESRFAAAERVRETA